MSASAKPAAASKRAAVRTVAAAIAAVGLGIAAALVWRGDDPGESTPAAIERPATPNATLSNGHPDPAPPQPSGSTPLWRVVDERPAQAAPAYPASWSEAGRALVDVTAAASQAHAWRVGDRLAVDLPQLGGVHEWRVERIDVGQDARSRSARGWIEGDGWRGRVVVTVGPGGVLAYIDTPLGPHELAGDARLAWLVPSSSMMAGFDFSQPDYILPEPNHGTP